MIEKLVDFLKSHTQKEFEEYFLENVEDIDDVVNELVVYAVDLAIDEGEQNLAFTLIESLETLSIKYGDNGYIKAVCNLSRSDILVANSKFDDALICLHEALKILEQIGDDYTLAECVSQMAGIFEEFGEKKEALSLLNQANKILRVLNKEQDVPYDSFVQNYGLIATIYYDEGDFKKAGKYYSIGKRIVDESEKYNIHTSIQNSFLNNYARFHVGNSNYAYAQKIYSDIYKLALRENQTELLFSALYNLVDISLVLDAFEKGKKQLQEAIEIVKKMNNSVDLARCHQMMGLLEYGIAKRDDTSLKKALGNLNRAKKILLTLEEKNLLGEVYFNMGNFIQDKYPEKALNYYELATPLINNYSYKHLIHINTANIKLDQCLYEEAFKQFVKGRKFLDKNANKELADYYIDIARLYYEQYQTIKAIKYYKKAIMIYKKVGNSLHDSKSSFFISKLKYFVDAIAISLEVKEYVYAFNFIEFSKSQRLLNMVNKKYMIDGKSYEVLVTELEDENDIQKITRIRKDIETLVGNSLVDKNENYLGYGDIRKYL